VQFLLEAGALREEEAVSAILEIRNVSRRNSGLIVANGTGSGFYLKQGIGEERRRTVGNEATILLDLQAALAHDPSTPSFLPELVVFDPVRCALVTRVVPNSKSLMDLSRRRRIYSETVACALGNALGHFHRLVAATGYSGASSADFVPFPFRAVEPELSMLVSLSAANVDLVRVVQNSDGYLPLLRKARADWNPEHLIHGDVRMDNCILSGSRRSGRVTIVDWELSGRGDPAWDVGTVLAEYIGAWLLSIPIVRDTTAEQLFSFARLPFSMVRRAVGAFMTAYEVAYTAYGPARGERITKAVRLAGVRLLQIAFEQLQAAHELSGQAVYVLQLSLNILKRPDQAAGAFFGIDVA
jgi:hypothetical protein